MKGTHSVRYNVNCSKSDNIPRHFRNYIKLLIQ